MTDKEYIKKVGHLPVDDDLERVNCPFVGKQGHFRCGWCHRHNKPRFMCGCLAIGQHHQENKKTKV